MRNTTAIDYSRHMFDLRLLGPERVHPISRREFDRMVESGVFEEDQRIELLRGVLVELSPQGVPHSHAIQELNERLVLALVGRAKVRPQCPYAALDDSQPEPDLAVVPLQPKPAHPRRAHLLVEVADTSLRKDRGVKAGIYAENGAPEYWIVNVAEGVVEVLREPKDGAYTQEQRYGPGESIQLVAFPDVSLAVDDFLPPLGPSDSTSPAAPPAR